MFFHVLLGDLWLGGAMYGQSLVAASHRKTMEKVARFDLIVLLALLVLMIFKPGARAPLSTSRTRELL